jgi:hypothetical protein
MCNNDEIVYYFNTRDNKLKENAPFKIVLIREIFEEENLNTNNQGYNLEFSDKNKLTQLLDAIFSLKKEINFWQENVKWDETKILGHIIARDYFDCMSGGMPRYKTKLVRYLCKNSRVNTLHDSYAGKTIQDFLNETNSVGDISEMNLEDVKTLLLN